MFNMPTHTSRAATARYTVEDPENPVLIDLSLQFIASSPDGPHYHLRFCLLCNVTPFFGGYVEGLLAVHVLFG
jgi:hypothetical protein